MGGKLDSMLGRLRAYNGVLLFWLMCVSAIPVWLAHDSSAWDVGVYGKALGSLQAGRDPYADATAVQKEHHATHLADGGSDAMPPYSYVYSPITLPGLQALGHVPHGALMAGYWALYVTGVVAALAATLTLATPGERGSILYAAGVAPFFPGLLANGTILGGNVAYILYGAILIAALRGWLTDRWLLFHAAVLLASCVKAPLLTLALIPALSSPRQWRSTLITMGAGLALFLGQMLIWPSLFRHYLEAVELQFSFNHDFGCSPAGLFGQFLFHYGLPYSPQTSLLYVCYALPLIAMLVHLSRRYLDGAFPLEQWAPVMLLGVILLNPRIMEYDVAPITIPMALVCWRVTSAGTGRRLCVAALATAFIVLNTASIYSWELRKVMDGLLLSLLFCGGCWMLLPRSNTGPRSPARTVAAACCDTPA